MAQLKETIALLLGDLNRALLAKDRETSEKQALFQDFVDVRKGSVQVLRLRDELEAQLKEQQVRYEEELRGLHDRFMHDLDVAQQTKQTAVQSVESSYTDALRRATARTDEAEAEVQRALHEVSALQGEVSAQHSRATQAEMEREMLRGMLDDERRANTREREQALQQRNDAVTLIVRHEETIRGLRRHVAALQQELAAARADRADAAPAQRGAAAPPAPPDAPVLLRPASSSGVPKESQRAVSLSPPPCAPGARSPGSGQDAAAAAEMGLTVTLRGDAAAPGEEARATAWLAEALTAGMRLWPGRLQPEGWARTPEGHVAVDMRVCAPVDSDPSGDSAPAAELCADLAILWAAYTRGEGAWAPGGGGDPLRAAAAILEVRSHAARPRAGAAALRAAPAAEDAAPRLLAVTVRKARLLCEAGLAAAGQRVHVVVAGARGERFRTRAGAAEAGPVFEESAAVWEGAALQGAALTVEVWAEGGAGGASRVGAAAVPPGKVADMAESGIAFWFPLLSDAEAGPALLLEAGPSVLLGAAPVAPGAPLPAAAMAEAPLPPSSAEASSPQVSRDGSTVTDEASPVLLPAAPAPPASMLGGEAEAGAGRGGAPPPPGSTAERWAQIPASLPEVRIGARDPAAPRGSVLALEPLPERNLFAAGGLGCEVSICRLAGGEWERLAGLAGHGAPVLCLAAPDACRGRRLLSGSVDGNIGLWACGAGGWAGAVECVGVNLAHEESVGALLALPGGHAASGSADETVKIWRLGQADAEPPLECLETLSGHTGAVTCLAAIDGGLLSGATDKTVVVWRSPPPPPPSY